MASLGTQGAQCRAQESVSLWRLALCRSGNSFGVLFFSLTKQKQDHCAVQESKRRPHEHEKHNTAGFGNEKVLVWPNHAGNDAQRGERNPSEKMRQGQHHTPSMSPSFGESGCVNVVNPRLYEEESVGVGESGGESKGGFVKTAIPKNPLDKQNKRLRS